jgi:PAS domain S-box-containing protein
MTPLRTFGGDVEGALEQINVPSYVIDASGVIRWVNPAAQRLVGDVRGKQFTTVVTPDQRRHARQVFADKIAGTAPVTDAETEILGDDGDVVSVELSSVPLTRGGKVIGVFGQVVRHETRPPGEHVHRALTPRQVEVLGHLAKGRSTRQIASELHLSPETVRNHVRHLLQALGVHSRLEAVAIAHAEHLLPDRAPVAVAPRPA